MPTLDASFYEKSNLRGAYVALRSLALYALLLAVGFFFDSWYLWVPLWCLGAVLFSNFFCLLHWSIHYSLFRTHILNDVIGRIFALLSLDSFVLYRYFHIAHHRLTEEEGDTEGFDVHSLRSYITTLARYFLNNFTRFADYRVALFANAENRARYFAMHRSVFLFDMALLALWSGVVAAATYYYPLVMLKGYFAPMLCSLPLLFFLDLAEHHGTSPEQPPYGAIRTIPGNAFTRFIAVYANYHLEHHLYPGVPYFRMPKLHVVIGPHVVHEERTYFAYHRTLLRQFLRT